MNLLVLYFVVGIIGSWKIVDGDFYNEKVVR